MLQQSSALYTLSVRSAMWCIRRVNWRLTAPVLDAGMGRDTSLFYLEPGFSTTMPGCPRSSYGQKCFGEKWQAIDASTLSQQLVRVMLVFVVVVVEWRFTFSCRFFSVSRDTLTFRFLMICKRCPIFQPRTLCGSHSEKPSAEGLFRGDNKSKIKCTLYTHTHHVHVCW